MSSLPTCNGGSSPLTRGKQPSPPSPCTATRLIPAHAGKTITRLHRHLSFPAHPRSRGENEALQALDRVQDGSSPLTRGKPGPRGPHGDRWGLIPAHAGKTGERGCKTVIARAHPRSRGENSAMPAARTFGTGSSPLTRGKRLRFFEPAGKAGLIPAHAGKTPVARVIASRSTAHPRSRGENPSRWRSLRSCPGSSPLTRGKLPDRGGGRKAGRLIPAHAGKTIETYLPGAADEAHPRSRGENAPVKNAVSLATGSSPLTRGKPPFPPLLRDGLRLIPAHAGKTLPDLRFYCADRSDLGNP